MEEPAAAATLAYGMDAIVGGVDLLAPGEMGIGTQPQPPQFTRHCMAAPPRAGPDAAPASTIMGWRAKTR